MRKKTTLLLAIVSCSLITPLSLFADDARLVQLFKRMDQDKNGMVTLEENWELWSMIFNSRDRNKDQKLDSSEMPGKAQKVADTNNDGFVDLVEEQAFRTKHFINMDADGDEKLTLSEMLNR